ncbi:MAG: SUMF1/EgtB/PvdO family nonheme iron enzyme [Magnetococcales bacterium]|nr:SUMF1/EgtB/PvdO family nonheme iron enzyme [Magnetococcales bacterium]
MIGHMVHANTLALRRQLFRQRWTWDDGPRGSNRVNRGGSWNNNPANVRSANRNNWNPGNRNNNLGFRLASTTPRQTGRVYGSCLRAQGLSKPSSRAGAPDEEQRPPASGRPFQGSKAAGGHS